MDKPRNIEGCWWVHGAGKDPVLGTLHYDSVSGVELHFKVADFQVPHQTIIALNWATNFPDVIQGQDRQGRAITLFGCTCRNWNLSGGLGAFVAHALVALIGQSLQSWEAANYSAVRFRLTLLDHWFNVSHLQVEVPKETLLQVRLIPLEEVSAQLPMGAKARFVYNFDTTQGVGNFHINENHAIIVEFEKPLAPELILVAYVEVFRRLFSFFVGTQCFVETVEFLIPGASDDWVEFLQPNADIRGAKRERTQQSMIVRYGEIAAQFAEILHRWFEYNALMDSAVGLYFASISNSSLYGSQKFLFLAQALEVYHGLNPNFVGSVETTQAFRTRRDEILDAAPAQQRGWLQEKLHHANQKTLAQRLADILAAHPQEVREFIADSESFAQKVRHTRNFYTHFDDELRQRGKIAEDIELNRLSLQMRTLLGICFLKDLQLREAPVQRIIERCKLVRTVSVRGITPNS